MAITETTRSVSVLEVVASSVASFAPNVMDWPHGPVRGHGHQAVLAIDGVPASVSDAAVIQMLRGTVLRIPGTARRYRLDYQEIGLGRIVREQAA